MTLLTIDEPKNVERPGFADHPIWRLGFRPFYLLAAAFAAISVPLWIARYFGKVGALAHVDLNWHMHEMLFGFAIAVIIGFLFTAGRNWTGLWTPRGGHLAALAGLWVAGRVAMLFADSLIAMLVDVAFLPLAGWPLYVALKKAGNKRNMFLIGLLGLLTFINILFHSAVQGWLAIPPMRTIEAAILVVVLIESVIGGRVIPMFTANGVPGVHPVAYPKMDQISLALTALAGLAWIFFSPSPFAAAIAFAAACAQIVRLAGWKSHRTLRAPLVWIMHLSYAWIPVGFLLLGFASLNLVTSSMAFHILTVGSMAGLIIGMMTRTSLGHTGRMLKAGRGEVAMYVLIQVSVIARFCAAMNLMELRDTALMIAAAGWSIAFLLYLFIYGPYLFQVRIDGREG